MSSQVESAIPNDSIFQQQLPQVYRATLQQFKRVTTSYVLFNFLFLTIFVAELFFFLLFLPFLMQSALLAISLSGLFLTIFSYFVLQIYYSAKKPEQLILLKDDFVQSCKELAIRSEGMSEHHLSIAAALTKLATYLEEFEWQFYQLPKFLLSFERLISGISAFCHWHDVFRFKQILINAAIEEHFSQIRLSPTDLEVHASLANTYIFLSKLFIEPARSPNPTAFRKKKDIFKEHFRMAAQMALVEFQILNHYAPNDPWIHEQLARGYRDLSMPKEEIKEIETLMLLRPQDTELKLRLGTLYFEQGLNAEGLKIYEDLRSADYDKSQTLIASFGELQNNLPSLDLFCSL